MRSALPLLVLLLLLPVSGCSLIGAGIAADLERKEPWSTAGAREVWTLDRDRQVRLQLRDGERLVGRIAGLSYAPADSYAAALSALAGELPALGESVSVRLIGDRQLHGTFDGFDGRSLLLGGPRAPDLDWVEELNGATVTVTGDRLRRRADLGEFPSRSRLRLAAGDAFRASEREVRYEDIAWIEQRDTHAERIVPILIGVAVDVYCATRLHHTFDWGLR